MTVAVFGQPLVKRPQEREPVVLVMLPAIFAIQHDADNVRIGVVAQVVLNLLQAVDEVGGRIAGIPVGVFEADLVA